jgi:hypothetical protein
MSAFRFAWTAQGVTQAVGISSPDISAVAPDGDVAMEMFSVVPRVTDAQPTHGSASATAKSSLIMDCPPSPGGTSRNLCTKARDRSQKDCLPRVRAEGASSVAGDLGNAAGRHFLSPSVA